MHSHALAWKSSGAFFGVPDVVKLPETTLWPQNRAEALYGGAAKGCYVQSDRAADTKKVARGRPFLALPFATIRYLYSSAVMCTRLLVLASVILY